jgi:hypothetical protein
MKPRRFAIPRHVPISLLVLAFCTSCLALDAAHARAGGRCISADVPSPIVLPDGSAHPAGSLRLCVGGEFTPETRFHEAQIDGRSIGLFIGLTRMSEGGEPGDPVVLFERNADGNLLLTGYAVPEDGRTRAYWMTGVGRSSHARAGRR